MKSTTAKFEITEFEALALHQHYTKKANEWKEKGYVGRLLSEEYTKNADKWIDIAIDIAKESESTKG